MRAVLCALAAALLLSLAVPSAWAQSGPTNPQVGIARWSSYKQLGADMVDRSNLNLHLEIPIFSRPTVGAAQVQLRLTYDSQFWAEQGTAWQPAPQNQTPWGWRLAQAGGFVEMSTSVSYGACGWYDPHNPDNGDDGSGDIYLNSYTFFEPDGVVVTAGIPTFHY
ncbi:MAG TPA: hypothetical protein VGS58_14175, partial [Candidatus Sulfopaludibacter sp.]|nr:hypothetical protein [Candidatus Sulfopaludibacter sp.]